MNRAFIKFCLMVLVGSIIIPQASITTASCHTSSTSVGVEEPNKWSVTVSPCAEFADTGIQFEEGDTLKIEPRSTSTTLQNVRKQFNTDVANGTSVSGTVVSTKKQNLRLANGSKATGIGTTGNEYLYVIKIPKGATTTPDPKEELPNREVKVPDFKNPTQLQYLSGLLSRAIQILLSLVAVVAVVVIVIAGFRLVLQGESESARTSAKKSITWAILGLIFALLSMGIVSIIQRLIQP